MPADFKFPVGGAIVEFLMGLIFRKHNREGMLFKMLHLILMRFLAKVWTFS